jgi:hypothetical protein
MDFTNLKYLQCFITLLLEGCIKHALRCHVALRSIGELKRALYINVSCSISNLYTSCKYPSNRLWALVCAALLLSLVGVSRVVDPLLLVSSKSKALDKSFSVE